MPMRGWRHRTAAGARREWNPWSAGVRKAAAPWLALGVGALAGCGKPPVPIDPRSGEVLDARYQPSIEATEVAGVIRLRGALATAEAGTVFVSICDRVTHMPARVRAYVYGGSEISDARDGERVLEFRVNSRDLMGGQVVPMPASPAIRVRYAPTGKIGAGSGEVMKETQVRYGARDVEITLP
jgi:hypothetical protein